MFKIANQSQHQAHVIVCGNEKGGSGKTTTIVHVTAALLNSGYRVATIDLDVRQKSFTRFIDNRENWSGRNNLRLNRPSHFTFNSSLSDLLSERDGQDLSSFTNIIAQAERLHDFILIDTPGHDGYLMRLAHSMADTLITPLNDSYVDFDVLGQIDPSTGNILELSHYAKTVRECRRQRRLADNGLLDWIVVRNRLTQLNSRNKTAMVKSLNDLSMQLGCRLAEGISERVIFRELFPIGLTVLDDLSTIGESLKVSSSSLAARREVQSLIASLRLPIDELGQKRAQMRKTWLSEAKVSIDTSGPLID